MSPIGSINSLFPSAISRVQPELPKVGIAAPGPTGAPATESFGQLLDGVVANVAAKQSTSQEMTRKVLMGQTDQLHQSMIAMQEASVAFSMMVEVRNKLVESYQELMRMQV